MLVCNDVFSSKDDGTESLAEIISTAENIRNEMLKNVFLKWTGEVNKVRLY